MSSIKVQFWHPRCCLEIFQAGVLENPWRVGATWTKQHRKCFSTISFMCSVGVSGMCLSWERGRKLIFCHSLILGCQSIFWSGACYNKMVAGKRSSCQPLPPGRCLEDKELEGSMVGAVNPIRASSKTLKCWNNSASAQSKNQPYERH